MLIFLISLLITVANAIVGSLTYWPIKQWYDFYIPIVLLVATYLATIAIWWIILSLISMKYSLKKEYDRPHKTAKFWLDQGHKWLMLHARVKIITTGYNKIPNGENFLLVANHRSNFDPMCLTATLTKYKIAYITKESNFKIPIFKRFIKGCCYTGIDRSDLMKSLQTMKRMVTLLENKACSVAVFPEGTRHTDVILGDFHEGVFNIALRAKAPIVVATIRNAFDVHKNFPFKRTKVYIDVLDVLNYEDVSHLPAKTISDNVHEMMREHLEAKGLK